MGPRDDHDLDDRPDDPVVVQTWLGAPALSYARRPADVSAVLDRAVRRWPDARVSDGARSMTVQELADLVEGTAAALRARGLRPGDGVAVAAGNALETLVLLLACARSRTVLVGLSTRLAPPQWEAMCAHMDARLRLAQPGVPLREAEDLASFVADAPPVPWGSVPVDPPAEDEAFAVVFTSGTTGRPKASAVVHRASVHSAMSYQRLLRLGPDDVTSVLFPLTYISALHAHVLPALLGGAAIVLVDTASPTEHVRLLRSERVTWAYAVPSWWRMCLRLAEFADLPHLRLLAAGGAPFPADLVAALRERLPHVALLDVYGLSETHSPACIATDEDLRAAPGSVGRPLPCTEVEVRGEDGRALGEGEPGGLWLRGSLVTTGYVGDPEATRRALVDGWFDTGDVARVDDGRVTVLDRTKDMINRGGAKVFSAEVEEVLRAHPAVEDAAVVGVPDRLAGEAVAAFVVPAGDLTAAQVRAWVRDRLAEHAAPRLVEMVDALPRNAVGKTDKPALRARLAAARGQHPQ